MHVKYEDRKVKELFEDLNDVLNSKNQMKKKIGIELTKTVKRRYNQIIAFSNFAALINSHIGKIESLEGEGNKTYSLHLNANYRLIIAPDTKDFSAEGLRNCDTFIIKGVVDYHGKGSNNNWIIP